MTPGDPLMNALSQTAAIWLIVAAVAVLALAAVLAMTEAALSRMTRTEAAALVAERRPQAVNVQALLADTSMTIVAATLVRTLARCAATVAVALAVWSLSNEWWASLLVTVVVVGLVDFVGVGVAPRTLGRQHAEAVVLRLAPLLTALTTVVGPIARVVVAVGNALTPGEGYRDGPFSTESELRELVDRASESDVIEAGERRMIHSVFELGDTLVREVMSPRTDMITVPAATPPRVALKTFLTSGLSRLPVVGEDVDDVLGVLFLKDLVRVVTDRRDPRSRGAGIAGLVRPATFVPESQRVDSLLREMQQQSVHLAIVIDEYGGVAGLVTLEDALEEIVGEIADEYDRAEPEVVVVDADTFRVSPRMSVDELGELFGLDLDDDEVDSVGGLLSKTLAAVPTEGDEARVSGVVLTAEKVEGNRLTAVLARWDDAEDDMDEKDEHVAALRGSSRARSDEDARGRSSQNGSRASQEQPTPSGHR